MIVLSISNTKRNMKWFFVFISANLLDLNCLSTSCCYGATNLSYDQAFKTCSFFNGNFIDSEYDAWSTKSNQVSKSNRVGTIGRLHDWSSKFENISLSTHPVANLFICILVYTRKSLSQLELLHV